MQRASKKRPTIIALNWDIAPSNYIANEHFDTFLDNNLLGQEAMAVDAPVLDDDDDDDGIEPASKTARLHPLATMVAPAPVTPASKTTGRKVVPKKY